MTTDGVSPETTHLVELPTPPSPSSQAPAAHVIADSREGLAPCCSDSVSSDVGCTPDQRSISDQQQQAGSASKQRHAAPVDAGSPQLHLQWQPCLATTAGHLPESRKMSLSTRTSVNKEYWQRHKHNSGIFNCGIVGDAADPTPVPVAAVDLAANSCWFQAYMDNRQDMRCGDISAVSVPCSIPTILLEQVVSGLYDDALLLSADNVEAIYRAADAMQMPAVLAACEEFLLATSCATEAHPAWVMGVVDLACELNRQDLCAGIAQHFALLAQHDAAKHKQVLCHVLNSGHLAGNGLEQMALLQAGHKLAWMGQGPELLLIHVMLEVHEALSAQHLRAMLEMIQWDSLQQEEVLVLVDWCIGLPASAPLAPVLKDRALQCVSAQRTGGRGTRYLVWKVDLEKVLASGQKQLSSSAISVRGEAKLRLDMSGSRDGLGLFLTSPVGTSLSMCVLRYTFFVLSPNISHRVDSMKHDIAKLKGHVEPGAAYGSGKLISKWSKAGMYKQMHNGAKLMTVGVIVTDLAV